jgi:hypothetical protein
MDETKQEAPVSSTNNKFIAIVQTEDGRIVLQAGGISMEEGIVLITKGYFKFKQEFEAYIQNNLR